MSRFALLEMDLSRGLDRQDLENEQNDHWLSLVPGLLPDISEDHARRALSRERPGEFILSADEAGIF